MGKDRKSHKDRPQFLELAQDQALPKAIICDMDGTLAHMCDRSPFNEFAAIDDTLNHRVANLVRMYKNAGYAIIIVSGRMDRGLPVLIEWLEKHSVPYDEIYMRKTGDSRKDSIVKPEIFEKKIFCRYNVELAIDDRLQVLKAWYDTGIFTLNVNQGNIEF